MRATPTLEIHRLWERSRVLRNEAQWHRYFLDKAFENQDYQEATTHAKKLECIATELNYILNRISDLEA